MTTALLEISQIAPPPEAAVEQSLPLIFLDMFWITFHPIRRLIFYEFPCSKPHFLEAIVPKLKQSLSLTLKHFFPLAGSIVYPLNSGDFPELRYVPGDTVPLTVCESSGDFDDFVADRARDADKFYDLIPQLPPMIVESDSKLLRVLALQVTLFPDRGVCIGFANHHSAGDAASIAAFLRRWSSISKIGGSVDEISISEAESLPIFDRSRINYPAKLDAFCWNQAKQIPLSPPPFPLRTNRVRATYVLSKSELEKLKLSIQSAELGLAHVSSFVAMAAYVWSCFAKSSLTDEEGDDDRLDFFLIAIDARARLDPPVPDNYFGNCIVPGLARVRRREIVSDGGGVFAAAQATAKAIKDRVSDKKKILEDVENWGNEIMSAMQGSFLAVSGSARVDLYAADFGFGRARKVEVLSIDGEKYAFSLCKSRDFEGGLEIGLSLPKLEMEAFAACFDHGIKNLV